MNITFDNSGGAYYAFYYRGRRVKNAELYKALKTCIIAACAVATTIVVATIAEDIITFGVGIWNDAISLVGAASSMISILLGGLRSFGFA